MKNCTQCGAQHDKHGSWCNPCRAAAMRTYRATTQGKAATRRMEANRIVTQSRIDAGAALRKQYAQTVVGRDVLRKASRKYQANHKAKIAADERKRRAANPMFRLAANMRRRLREVLGASGKGETSRTNSVLGCSPANLRNHIEQQFQPGMSWANYGSWHVDHIVPLRSADSVDALVQLCHYTNLQPLWAQDNRVKQDMLPDKWQKYLDAKKNASRI